MASRVGNYIRQHHLALLCLFLILGGGTAWALDLDSVRSKHIVDGEILSADVGHDALTKRDIAERSVEPDGFGAFHDAATEIPDLGFPNNTLPPREDDESVLSLDLPAGNYFVLAKGQAFPTSTGNFLLDCRLYADGDFDEIYLWGADTAPIALTVLASASKPFTADLACADRGTPAKLSDLKVHAIPIRDRFNTPK